MSYQIAYACTRTRMLYLHTRLFLHACMFVWLMYIASQPASYLPFSLSYNAIFLVILLFLYRALAAHQGVEDKIAEEVESTGLILQLSTTHLMEAFLLPAATAYTTQDAWPSSIIDVRVSSTNTIASFYIQLAISYATTLLCHAHAANGMDLLSILLQL